MSSKAKTFLKEYTFVNTLSPPKGPTKRQNKENLPVMFVRKRVIYPKSKGLSQSAEIWVAEYIRADLIKNEIYKEYYGTLPFNPKGPPPADRGTYDEVEKSIHYFNKAGKDMVVDCIIRLDPLENGILLSLQIIVQR